MVSMHGSFFCTFQKPARETSSDEEQEHEMEDDDEEDVFRPRVSRVKKRSSKRSHSRPVKQEGFSVYNDEVDAEEEREDGTQGRQEAVEADRDERDGEETLQPKVKSEKRRVNGRGHDRRKRAQKREGDDSDDHIDDDDDDDGPETTMQNGINAAPSHETAAGMQVARTNAGVHEWPSDDDDEEIFRPRVKTKKKKRNERIDGRSKENQPSGGGTRGSTGKNVAVARKGEAVRERRNSRPLSDAN